MKQKGKKRREPTAADVIRSASFVAPMRRWGTLAAAVSNPKYTEVMIAFEK
jgi:hypothetical protein